MNVAIPLDTRNDAEPACHSAAFQPQRIKLGPGILPDISIQVGAVDKAGGVAGEEGAGLQVAVAKNANPASDPSLMRPVGSSSLLLACCRSGLAPYSALVGVSPCLPKSEAGRALLQAARYVKEPPESVFATISPRELWRLLYNSGRPRVKTKLQDVGAGAPRGFGLGGCLPGHASKHPPQ